MVHMKKYSFRVNPGAEFAPLFFDEGSSIKVVFKVFNGSFKMFYKEDEEA